MPAFQLTKRLSLPSLFASVAASGNFVSGSAPAPPPAPAPGGVEITPVPVLDPTRVIMFGTAYQVTGSYDRFQHMNGAVLTGSSATISFRGWNFSGGTNPRNFSQATYTLNVDGFPMATASPGTGVSTGSFVLDLTGVSEGWHILSIDGAPGETTVPHGFYVLKGAAYVEQPWIPVITGTYEFTQQGPGSPNYNTGLSYRQFHIVKVPGVLNRRSVPLDKRLMHDRDGFTAKLNNNELVAYHLVPFKFGDRHNPCISQPYSILTSYARQDYFWEDFLTKRPPLSLLDGPRGVGAVKFPTSLKFSKRPDGRKLYFTDGWRFGVIDESGAVRTLAGWRHKNPPPHWQNPGVGGGSDTVWGANTEAQLELVGDWSSMPVDRQGFYEPWGMDFADPTLTVDTSSAVIDAGNDPMEQPHVIGPVAYVADTHHNRVIKVVFQADARTPGVCTEFITGLSDPWDLVYDSGKLYISERTAHRISVYNAATGAFIENLVSNPVDMSGLSASRFTFLRVPYTRTQAQAADVVGPEGMDLVNGWLYYGSSAMRCIKRINVTTKVIQFWLQLDKDLAKSTLGFSDAQVFFFPWPDINSNFLNFSVSDGTFGPEGTCAIATWSVAYYGLPLLFQPDNLHWDVTPGSATAGQGGTSSGYVSATAVKNGVMVYGGAEEGVCFYAKKSTQDVTVVNQGGSSSTGKQNYLANGFHLAHGLGGYGYFNTGDLPWGVNTNIDAFLRFNLHVRVPTWRKGKTVNEWFALPNSSITGDADGRLAFSGMALQSTQVAEALWLGPGGGHNDNSDNSVRSIDLLADAPAMTLRLAATPAAQRTVDAAYYADGRPSASHLYGGWHYIKRKNRVMRIGVYAAYGSGNFNSAKVSGFNPSTNTWDSAATHPDAGMKYSCLDGKGDVWGLTTPGAHFASALSHWNRNGGAQTQVIDYGSPAGGPIGFDSKREQLFSLSWGNGEDKFGSGVRAFAYRKLYSVTADTPNAAPTRTAITLTSIGGALEQFQLDRTEYGALDYDAGLDVFLFYDGRNVDAIDRRGRVYVIRPTATSTWEISILSLGSGTGTPPHVKGAGVNSRFRYVPKLKGFVLYADGAQPLWFLPTEFIEA
jgi:hypothetical protein